MKAFLRDESGATAIEYGILAALMAVAVVAAVSVLDLEGLFGKVQKAISGAVPSAGT